MKRIKDGYKGKYMLGFSVVDSSESLAEVAFFKFKPGNEIPHGFAFDCPYFEQWEELLEFLLDEQFEPFWKERNGFALSKYMGYIADFWKHLEGAPSVGTNYHLFLPEYQAKLIEKFGIAHEAWTDF
jgi:hypothetical protein